MLSALNSVMFWNLTTCLSHKGSFIGLLGGKLRILGHFIFLPTQTRSKNELAVDTISEGSGRESQSKTCIMRKAALPLLHWRLFGIYSPSRLSPIDTENRNLPSHKLSLNLPCLHKRI